MARRQALVLEVGPGHLRLRPMGDACGGCGSGCGGRCQLFRTDDALELPWDGTGSGLRAGDKVCLRLDELALRRMAWLGYGRGLGGLLAGAGLGHALGTGLGAHEDILALAGLLVGTLLATSLSKRAAWAGLSLDTECGPPGPVEPAPSPTHARYPSEQP